MRTKLDVVSGFLGAGKTTFIQKLIRDVYIGESIVVLENEFGKISLDGETLERDGIRVESICAGCICCSGAGALSEQVVSIAQRLQPDRIVIEPTGLAMLSEIKRLLSEPFVAGCCELDHVVTVVDAKNFNQRMMISQEFFENQIQNSTLLFLSKTGTMEPGQIDDVRTRIRQINPDCMAEVGDWQQLSGEYLRELLKRSALVENSAEPEEHHHHSHGDFESFTFEGGEPVDAGRVELLLNQIQDGIYGDVFRVKGVFQDTAGNWFRFDYVPRNFEISPIVQNGPISGKKLQLCVIGAKLKKDLLEQVFKAEGE